MIKKVFIFHAKAEAGKDFCCEKMREILENKGYKVFQIAFADYVRAVVTKIYGITDYKSIEGRSAMQELGTNMVRARDEDFWVDTVGRLCLALEPFFDYVLISDARFPNEIRGMEDYFPNLIKTILVQRPDVNSIDKMTNEQREHTSEISLDHYIDWDYIINNITGEQESTYSQIEKIVNEEI